MQGLSRGPVSHPILPPETITPLPPARVTQARVTPAPVPPAPQDSAPVAPAPQEPASTPDAAASFDITSRLPKINTSHLKNLVHSWKFWIGTSALIFSSTGFIATAALLKLPAVPNCPAIFWPTASASLRLYCAQLAANKDTIDDLLTAIRLVNELPDDHPLRPEINRSIEQWSKELLKLCDKTFQEGNLDEAIAMARKIPSSVAASSLVEERINKWQSIWSEAESIYKKADSELRKQNWPQAFREAVKLLDIDNKYWATTKYQEFSEALKSGREDGGKLGKAYSVAEQGGLENLLEAIKIAQNIDKKSHSYDKAQEAIKEFSRQMMDLAEESLEKRDLSGALEIARQIPQSANLKEEVEDFIELAKARSQSWLDTVSGLESAIAQAQKISDKRPLYAKSRSLITQWKESIENLGYLEKARSLAKGGSVSDLKAAISQAQKINRSKPRSQEAEDEINQWQSQIETTEDRPYLEKAEMLAKAGDIASLQAAINQAGIIARGRALYNEAQDKIDAWNRQIQTQQDQPMLDRANSLAVSGSRESLQAAISEARKISNGRALYDQAQGKIEEWNRQIQEQEDRPYLDSARQMAAVGQLSEAIAKAERILPGRALYSEAQNSIQSWQDQISARRNLDDAYRYAGSATPETLASAIRTANQVSDSSSLRSEAENMISQWSQQILSIAQERATTDPQGAIDIANKIPSYSPAYGAAMSQMDAWRRQLNPAPVIPSVPAPSPTRSP